MHVSPQENGDAESRKRLRRDFEEFPRNIEEFPRNIEKITNAPRKGRKAWERNLAG
jgi:hypothetical protein